MTTHFPPQVTHPWMIVCGVDWATDLLMSTNTYPHIGAVISIADVTYGPTTSKHRPPEIGVQRVPRRCVLTFDDVYDDDSYGVAPSPEDVKRIIRFAGYSDAHRAVAQPPGPERVLIHCHAGVSRSTAAGLIWLATRLGPGQEAEAAAQLVAACVDKEPNPNKTMVKYADEQLGRNGALIEVSENFYRLGALLAAKVARGDV